MRTTISVDDELLKEAKKVAAASGRNLNQVVEEALRETLARRRDSSKRPYITLRTFKGTGVRPGVDIDNSASLWDLLDGLDDSP